jgi:hypothetical protein
LEVLGRFVKVGAKKGVMSRAYHRAGHEPIMDPLGAEEEEESAETGE